MTKYTVDAHALPYPEGVDKVAVAADLQALAAKTGTALTKEGIRAEDAAYNRAKWKRGAIPTGVSVREEFYGADKVGQWACLSGSICATLTDLPEDLQKTPTGFTLTVQTMGDGVILKINTYDVWGDAEYICNSAPSGSVGWTRWRKYLFDGDIPEANNAPPPSGFKTVPLALTSPANASSTDTSGGGTLRYPLKYAVPIPRWRVHIQNINDRSGTVYPGIISFTGAWVAEGNHTTGAFTKQPLQVMPAFRTQADGSEFVGPWISDFPLSAATDYLLSMGASTPTGQENTESYGAVFRTANSATANAWNPQPMTLSKTGPFSVWIEAEVPENVPVIAELGSSGAAGVGSTHPMLQSALALYARKHGALPMYYAHSGSTLGIWEDASHHKWQKWQAYARPDALYISLGQNDLFGSATLAQVQESAAKVLAAVRMRATDNVYMTTIPPRTSAGDETTRRLYNEWLKARPLGIRDVFDVSAALSSDDETIRPEYDADGIHANSAGSAAKVEALNRPMFQSFQRYTVDTSAGRVITAWDYVNNREQMIYGDSGYRLLPNDPAKTTETGNIFVRRVGNMVEVVIGDKTTVVGGNPILLNIPAGFRPWGWVNSNLSSVYDTVAPSVNGLRITTVGDLYAFGVSAGELLRGHVVYMTPDPWPTSLPGKPNGATP